LQKLYKKYNVTENDIKFAKGELPHYLMGTVLYDKEVIVIEDFKLLDDEHVRDVIKKSKPEIVMTSKQRSSIMEKARERYIKKYSVDPANPKVDILNGVPLPKEYVRELVRSGKLGLEDSEKVINAENIGIKSSATGPQAINGKVYVHIVEAKNDQYWHKPDGSDWLSGTYAALDRFEEEFGVDMIPYEYWNAWDLSDISPAYNASEALKDLEQDFAFFVVDDNHIVIGWADRLDHNGIARMNRFHSVGVEDPCCGKANWPDDSVAQHEISHLFNAGEGGYWCWEHPECIMNYCHAFWGTDEWCGSHWYDVFVNINGIHD